MKSNNTLRGLLTALLHALLCFQSFAIRLRPQDVANTTTTTTTTTTSKRRLRQNVEVPVPSSPDDHLVKSLPLLDPEEFPTPHWAGHLPASSKGDKYFFYWLFAPDAATENAPLIIWLNGGPGCSSMDGLFLENGPFRLVKDASGSYQLKADPHSWHKAPAYTLYIDQPVGTGLSFTTSTGNSRDFTSSGGYPRNDAEVNVDFYSFLQSFFQLHADKFVQDNSVTNEVYFSGESHSGHYIPHMMHYILQQNTNNNTLTIPMAGAAIGNGWIHPYFQYAAAKAAYGKSLIDHAQMAALNLKEATCQQLLKEGKYSNGVCFQLLDAVTNNAMGRGSGYKVSQYDARKTERTGSAREFPPGHKVVETYLGGHSLAEETLDQNLYKQVLEAIHATAVDDIGQKYRECTDPPYNALSHQDGKGVVEDVVAVLEENVRLLFFNGVEDLICNHVGNEWVLENLPWKHQHEWTQAPRYAWKAENADAAISGYMKEYANLMFLKVLHAGHMVPMDVPETALEMMQRFLQKQSFQTFEQSLDRSLPPEDACSKDDNHDNE